MKKLYPFMLFLLPLMAGTAQNVGIGTLTPSAKLEIRHSSGLGSPTLTLFDNNAGNFSRLQFQNASGIKFWHVAGYLDNATDANSRLNFFHSVSGDVLSLTGDGKIGIGTITPRARLNIFKGSSGFGGAISVDRDLLIESNDHSFINLLVPDNRETGILFGKVAGGSASGGIVYDGNNSLHLRTDGNVTRVLLTAGGNLGIGNNTPSSKLDVAGDVRANSFTYSVPASRIVSIGAADFQEVTDSDVRNLLFCCPPGVYMVNGSGAGLVAPVQLPDGATVTGLAAYFYDNSADNLNINLQQGNNTGFYSGMAGFTTSGTPGSSLLLDVSISNATIDNASFHYFIMASSTGATWVNENLRIASIKISYTLPQPQ